MPNIEVLLDFALQLSNFLQEDLNWKPWFSNNISKLRDTFSTKYKQFFKERQSLKSSQDEHTNDKTIQNFNLYPDSNVVMTQESF